MKQEKVSKEYLETVKWMYFSGALAGVGAGALINTFVFSSDSTLQSIMIMGALALPFLIYFIIKIFRVK